MVEKALMVISKVMHSHVMVTDSLPAEGMPADGSCQGPSSLNRK